MTTVTSQPERTVRADLLAAALDLLDQQGPDALQTRKVAAAAGTSTMAVYTHFGGMSQLITAVTEEGLRQFDRALSIPTTEDPVTDLLTTGIVYRNFAIERPHLYRLMFGSTSAHGINAPAHNMLTLGTDQIDLEVPSFAHLVRGVHRSIQAGRLTVTQSEPDGTVSAEATDRAVVAIGAQFWTVMHGFMMLELAGFFGDVNDGLVAAAQVLSPMTISLLVALGDTPEQAAQSLATASSRSLH